MSHTVKSQVQMKNAAAMDRAIKHLGLTNMGHGRHKMFDGSMHTGTAIKLPGWNYHVVIDPIKGEAIYDNYGGGWGAQLELDKLVQRYTIEVTIEEAVAGGYNYSENVLANGDVELEMEAVASA